MSSVSWSPTGAPYYNAIQKRLYDRMDPDQNSGLDQDQFQAGRSKTLVKERAKLYDTADNGQSATISRVGARSGYSMPGMGAIGQLSTDALDVLMQLRPQDGANARNSASLPTGEAGDPQTLASGVMSSDQQATEAITGAVSERGFDGGQAVVPAYLGAAALLSNLTAGPGAAYGAADTADADGEGITLLSL